MQNNSNEQHDFFNNHNPSGNNLSKDNLEDNKNEFPISTLVNSEVKEGQMDTFGFGANNIHNDQNVEDDYSKDSMNNQNKENLGKIKLRIINFNYCLFYFVNKIKEIKINLIKLNKPKNDILKKIKYLINFLLVNLILSTNFIFNFCIKLNKKIFIFFTK